MRYLWGRFSSFPTRLSLLLALSLVLPVTAHAQAAADAPSPRVWAGGGGGLGSAGSGWFGFTAVQVTDGYFLSARASKTTEMRGEAVPSEHPVEDTYEASLLLGHAIAGGGRAVLTAWAIIGLVGGVRRGQFLRTEERGTDRSKTIIPPVRYSIDWYTEDRLEALGLPLEIRLHTRPTDTLELDLVAFGNLNATDAFGGVAVQDHLGPVW